MLKNPVTVALAMSLAFGLYLESWLIGLVCFIACFNYNGTDTNTSINLEDQTWTVEQ